MYAWFLKILEQIFKSNTSMRRTHTHTCVYIYIYICVCVCVCVRKKFIYIPMNLPGIIYILNLYTAGLCFTLSVSLFYSLLSLTQFICMCVYVSVCVV